MGNSNKKRFLTLVQQEKESLSGKDILMSEECREYMQDTCRNIIIGTGRYLRRQGFPVTDIDINARSSIRVNFAWMKGECAGWTDSKEIHLNPAGCVAKTLQDKMLELYAVTAHECGHITFTDFKIRATWLQKLENEGCWVPSSPKNYSGSALEWMMQHKNVTFRRFVLSAASSIQNAVEDGYIEQELSVEYPGTVKSALDFKGELMLNENIPTFKEWLDAGPGNVFNAIFNEMLIYAKYKAHFLGGYDGELMQYLEAMYPIVDAARSERNPSCRMQHINDLMVYLAEAVKQDIQDVNQQQKEPSSDGKSAQGSNAPSGGVSYPSDAPDSSSGQSDGDTKNGDQPKESNAEKQEAGNSSDSGNKTSGNQQSQNGKSSNGNPGGNDLEGVDESVINDVLNNVMNKMDSSSYETDTGNSSLLSTGNTTSVTLDSKKSKNSESSEQSDTKKFITDVLESMKKELAQRKAEETAEAERLKEMQQYASVHLNRNIRVSKEDIDKYRKIAVDVLPVSRRLQKGILQLFKDRRNGSTNRNLFIGQRFEAGKVVNKSGRYFAKRNLPTESPKLRVDILIDESGSTAWNGVCKASVSTSIAIEDFCRALDIQNRIAGYRGHDGCCQIDLLAEPEKVGISNSDRYRLTTINAKGSTPTYKAMEYILSGLYKATEEYKLLIVITDGVSDDGGDGKIQNLVSRAKHRGITVLAAGVGSSRSSIEREFGKDNFLDIEDLDMMPKRLIGLIKRMMPL